MIEVVDLIGSERIDKSEVTGDRLKEAQHINESLSALGDVISSLAQKNSHVPYRNSKLTQLLQDSLGGQAKTLMFVHISPELEALRETISTLKFAERVATVELGAVQVNKYSADVKELKEQISSLKIALARKDGESEQLLYTQSSTLERSRMKSGGSSPQSSLRSLGDISSNRRQPMEEVENIQVQVNHHSFVNQRVLHYFNGSLNFSFCNSIFLYWKMEQHFPLLENGTAFSLHVTFFMPKTGYHIMYWLHVRNHSASKPRRKSLASLDLLAS